VSQRVRSSSGGEGLVCWSLCLCSSQCVRVWHHNIWRTESWRRTAEARLCGS